MANEVMQAQSELTVTRINPTLNNRGNIFMSDGGGINTEGGQNQLTPARAHAQKGATSLSSDQLMSKWQSVLSPGELQDPDIRRTINAAIELHIAPESKTSKGEIAQTAEEVVKNSFLDSQDPKVLEKSRELLATDLLGEDLGKEKEELFGLNEKRLRKAEELLGEHLFKKGREKLTDAEKVAILRAHFTGDSGVYRVPREQLARKAEILKEADFSNEERRILIEAGLIAANFPFSIPEIQDMADTFRALKANNALNRSTLEQFQNRASEFGMNHRNLPNVDDEIARFMAETQESMREFGRGRDKYDELQLSFIEQYNNPQNHAVIALKAQIQANEEEIFRLQAKQNRTTAEEDELEQRHSYHKRLDRGLYNLPILHAGAEVFSMKDIIEQLPLSSIYIDSKFVEVLSDSDKALEYLIAKIIDPPTDQETNAYEIDFQAGINWALIRGALMSKALHSDLGDPNSLYKQRKTRVQYEGAQIEKGAVQIFHEVHRALTTGNFEGVGASLKPEHFEYLQRKLGAGAIQRYIERMYYTTIAQNGYVSGQINDRIMGSERDPYTGRPIAIQQGSILSSFERHRANAQGLAQYLHNNGMQGVNIYDELSQMDTWELQRARNLGRILYSVSERPSEVMALGSLPQDEENNLSIPREDSVRVIDQLKWIYQRWAVSDRQGGMKFQSLRRKFFNEIKREDGYRDLGIEKMLAGQGVGWIESVGDIGVSGIYSTWRELEIILTRLPMAQPRTIRILNESHEFNHYDEYTLNNYYDIFMNYGKLKHTHDKAHFLEEVFLDHNGNLRDEFRSGIGILARRLLPSDGDLGGHGEKSTEIWEIKERIRAKLWERAAEDEPLVIASFLHGLKYKKGKTPSGADSEIKIFGSGGKVESLGVDWTQFEDKMTWFTEVKTNLYRAGRHMSLAEVIQLERDRHGVELTPEERNLYDYIKTQGAKASKDFANVKFSIEPFMTDIPFEVLDISRAGPTFIKRRLSGDWGAVMGSHKAMGALLDNIAGTDPEKAMEILAESRKALAGPYGAEGAQKKLFPMFEALATFVEKGGITNNKKGKEDYDSRWNYTLLRQLRKSPIGDVYLTFMRKPKSIAQQFAGLEAAALDESDMYRLGEDAVKMALIDHHLFEKYKKKFAGPLRNLVWFFRDVFFLAFAVSVINVTKESVAADEFKS